MQAIGRTIGPSGSLCSSSYQFKSAAAGPQRLTTRPRRAVVRAEGDQTPAEAPAPSAVDEEARLEALEASVRTKKGARPPAPGGRGSGRASSFDDPYAEWKEGQLFPEGWEKMDPLQKATELYLGKRGILFWSTKAAWGGIISLIVAWAVFRFLGPALGLYQLANETPNF